MNFIKILSLSLGKVVSEYATAAADFTLKLRTSGKELNPPYFECNVSVMAVIVKRTLAILTHNKSL